MIDLGEVKVHSVVFKTLYRDDCQYIVTSESEKFREQFGYVQVKQCDGANFDGWGKYWYAVYISDCFDPPVVIVRADDESEAIDVAVDAYPYMQMGADTVAQIEKDIRSELPADCTDDDVWDKMNGQVGITGDGVYYDCESLGLFEVKPVTAYFEKEVTQ